MMMNLRVLKWYQSLTLQDKQVLAEKCNLSRSALYRKMTSRTQMTLEVAFKIIIFSKGHIKLDWLIEDFDYSVLNYLSQAKQSKGSAPDLSTSSDL